MALRTYGTMQVDWEQRADFDRLRTERLARAKAHLKRSELGALLCFDMNNIRYITATHIGTWAMDKLIRFCLLPQDDEPIMWDFGSAARHRKLYSPWLGEERSRAGISTLRGAVEGRAESVAQKIRVELEERGLLNEPLGVDVISGERCSPHPHVFTDRMLRPGDPAYFDILHAYNGYRTCYYRTFAVGSASRALIDAYARCRDVLDRAISMVRPGVTTAEVVSVWPEAQEFGFPDEEAAFALQYGHGVGLSIWEKPVFSRLVSFDHPETIEESMVFALETFWPATDGWSAARIEEQLVVTSDGCEVITRFPAEELLVAGGGHTTAMGVLPGVRESQSNLNNPSLAEAVVDSAAIERMHVD